MIVLLDVDGPIADFTGGALEAIRKVSGKVHTEAEVTAWDFFDVLDVSPADRKSVVEYFIQAPGWAYDLQPQPGAVEGVLELAKIADVYFVTSPWWGSPTWVYDRRRWLMKYFGELGKKVIPTEHKHMVRGGVLVDDKPEHLFPPRDVRLLWDMPHNKKYRTGLTIDRVYTWAEVHELCESL